MPGFADLVGCRLPLQLASLGGIGTPELAAAVSEAGGLGMIPNPMSAEEAEQKVAAASALTGGPIGVGFLMPFLVREAVEAAARDADVVEFFYGAPDRELVQIAGAGGTVVGWQTGSAAEALAAQEAGCGYVVIQGIEAGGHVRGTQLLDEALAETLAAVDVPVVAAGGIGTAERVSEVLDAGASAVRVGTRFVAAEEADAHTLYVHKLIAATAADTELTETFNLGWPHAPHRVLRSAIDAAGSPTDSMVGSVNGQGMPLLNPLPPSTGFEGNVDATALYCGESVDAVTRRQPAAEIATELIPA